MATIGHMKGVAQIYGVSVAGLPAWLLWRAFYLSRIPTLGRKLRIFVEWTWSMFHRRLHGLVGAARDLRAAGLDVAPPVERAPEAMPGVGVRT